MLLLLMMTMAIQTCPVVVDFVTNSVEVRSSTVRYKICTQQHTQPAQIRIRVRQQLESSRSFGTCDSLATCLYWLETWLGTCLQRLDSRYAWKLARNLTLQTCVWTYILFWQLESFYRIVYRIGTVHIYIHNTLNDTITLRVTSTSGSQEWCFKIIQNVLVRPKLI